VQGLLPWLTDLRLPAEPLTDLRLRAARYRVYCGLARQALELLDAMSLPEAAAARREWLTLRTRSLLQAGRLDEALADGRQALAAAPDGSHDQAEVLVTLWQIAMGQGRLNDAADHADACLAAYTRLGDVLGRARGLLYRATSNIERGELGSAEPDLRDAAALAAQHGYVNLQRAASYNLAALYATDLSRPAQALPVLREAWPDLLEASLDGTAVMYRGLLLECLYQLGDSWRPP
jgi:tetratricopeptide (TPR) repeat protein